MSFTSPLFFLALVPLVAAFYLLPGQWRAIYLLALSYAFYALSSRVYLVLLIVASAGVYALGLAIAKSGGERAKTALMWVGVAAVVALIVVFKAAGAWRGLLLPLGVSYYSFKLISYLIEVYWDDEAVERDPVVFLLFPAFFPQIVSGPIQRPEPFFTQMRDVMGRTLSAEQVETGIPLHPWRPDDEDAGRRPPCRLHRGRRQVARRFHLPGHSDHCSPAIRCSSTRTSPDIPTSRSASAGCSASKVRLTSMRLSPPSNIQEMWRRWHMSLTLWLTDYLFTPMSMALRDFGQVGLIASVCLNMIIIGIWHGFTLNFLVFGVLQAVFLSVDRVDPRALAPAASAPPERRLRGSDFGLARAAHVLGFLGARLDLRSHELLPDLFPFLDLGRGHFSSPTGAWGHAERADRLVGSAGQSHSSHARSAWRSRSLTARARPASEGLARSVSTVAPRWLQYGVCIFLLTVLSTAGTGQFIYGQF